MPSVLLVEDEAALALIVQDSLTMRGFAVRCAANGAEGLRLFREQAPDIVVADVMMPVLDGFSLAEQIRRGNQQVPIIFLTARSQPADVVRGFELGGNDYLRKPFSMDELIVRIQALLARSHPAPTVGVLPLGRFRFDYPRQKLMLDGQEKALSHLRELWGDDSFFNGRSLDVFITKLRQYLRPDDQVQIVNIRGVGYKLML